MQKPSFVVLREYAEAYLRIAAEAGSEKERRLLIDMAGWWHALAQEREGRVNGSLDQPLAGINGSLDRPIAGQESAD